MSGLSEADRLQLQTHLQNAVIACNERCLYQSAKWIAELLNSIPTPIPDLTYSSDTEEDETLEDVVPPRLDGASLRQDRREAKLESKEMHRYLMAKSYFDCREYDRCSATFLPSLEPQGPLNVTPTLKTQPGKAKLRGGPQDQLPMRPSNPTSSLSQKALFLALYAKYIAGEKRKDEDSEMILGPNDGGSTVNKELGPIGQTLEQFFAKQESQWQEGQPWDGQGWLEYLYGVVLLKGKNDELAMRWLIRSVNCNPWHWGAWQEIAGLIGSVEQLSQTTPLLPKNIMTLIFHIHVSQELYQTTDEIHHELNQISSVFPENTFLKTQRALLHYHSKDFEEAERLFNSVLIAHPHRLDSLDAYSNILYVLDNRPKLAYLASIATSTDKFRPETCCVVGNYLAKRSEHEKAVMYFRRALTLDRNCLSAWTLMGHEYIELKNTHAAVESYRRAVDINRKDYRAWYGLGQTYEILELHSYALFYYQRAAALRPFDPKLWMAVASCYGKIGKTQNAIRAYKRALVAGSYYEDGSMGGGFGSEGLAGAVGGVLDPEILYQIALLYEKTNEREEAAAFMELTLAQEEGPSSDDAPPGASPPGPSGIGVTATTSKARMWLAKWSFMRGDFQRATELANELCQDGVEVEEAKALIRDVRARMGVGGTGGAGSGDGPAFASGAADAGGFMYDGEDSQDLDETQGSVWS
ncbi:anaphase promoting complex subunit 8 [Cryomyces antarcticus]